MTSDPRDGEASTDDGVATMSASHGASPPLTPSPLGGTGAFLPPDSQTDGTPPARARGPGDEGRLVLCAGVRLRPGGRSVSCDVGGLGVRVGTPVVIQSERGPELGIVTVAPARRPVRGRMPRIARIGNDRDLERGRADDLRAAEAVTLARESVRALNLDIKMFHAELQGGGRITLFFASEARVDFRDLVRDLSSRLRARVELRQVGVRDEAKMVGGIGSCGRELCCSTFLPRFAPVSIKAAKNQNLALTPSKVSGQCGRLKCCLVYEEAAYVEAARKLPRIGKRVETPDGVGKVVDLDILRGRVRVAYPDAPPKIFEAGELRPEGALPAPPGVGGAPAAPASGGPAVKSPPASGPPAGRAAIPRPGAPPRNRT